MRKLVALVAALAVTGGALYLGFMLVVAGPGACPTALLQGTLVKHDGTLAVAAIPGGGVAAFTPPFGYWVGHEDDGTLTLTRVFVTVAREGDQVSMSGGTFGNDAVFSACGPVVLGLTIPPDGSSPNPVDAVPAGEAWLEVTGTAYEPCIPPPSGCGYWVILRDADGRESRAALEHHRSYESAVRGDPEPLTLADGLPANLPTGGYDITFQVGAFSDAASPVALPDGSMGYPPVLSTACMTHLDVPVGTRGVTVGVTYHGSTCTVVIDRG